PDEGWAKSAPSEPPHPSRTLTPTPLPGGERLKASRRTPMEIRPILSTLRRHKTAAALIVVEIALACAIVCNALFLVSQRVENLGLPSGIAEHELLQVRLSGIGKQDNADARSQEDLAALRAVPGVTSVAITNQVPFQNGSWNSSLTLTPDQEEQ